MTLNLRVMAPNRTVRNSEVQEIILSTNSGQIGVLPNHAPLLTALDIGIMKVRLNGQWSTMALMGGFAMMDNNQITILVNEAEEATEIDPEEAREAFQKAQTDLAQVEGRKQTIEANLASKRAKARLEAINTTFSSASN
uniref:ATP synthase epsilon chain, chloroplastic n=22 Tax=Isoetes TaxID=13838 RepID=A0A3G2BW67_9TRAC|nr:ATP synthase CF1 epsilon subunit [Isoetes flaccida]YP_009498610.1 ATP synthase CF1 epsilon subunit [Isoetes butleri]YP_009498862.1 ATP synthase CF1 epsilon subunit [Isoetes valida]YP_009499306.1 ATP synthase CF1 epsilon subunit [Isoetes engelmannii]YP_009528732.1 ATP synthase CF1 epsilon subunit [Isoetes mattaponica]YP_009536108.1 ATP synthase CF1 epsilon subunit [Isoetes graniticola]YP_009555521.1 ATP synthase CF1 subunit epsilon [Isoetes malinverniana]YP_009555605.1 ATP synthase CF1 eps